MPISIKLCKLIITIFDIENRKHLTVNSHKSVNLDFISAQFHICTNQYQHNKQQMIKVHFEQRTKLEVLY